MSRRLELRLADIIEAAADIRALLAGKSIADLRSDRFLRAAFERFLEIISEASRHVPEELKRQFGPELPWRQIADLGNQLRHAYHGILPERLWAIYEDELVSLEHCIGLMLKAEREI